MQENWKRFEQPIRRTDLVKAMLSLQNRIGSQNQNIGKVGEDIMLETRLN